MKNLENLSQRSISLKMQLYWSKLKRNNKPKLAGRLYVKNVVRYGLRLYIPGDPGAVCQGGTKKPRAKLGTAKVYK